MTTIERLKVKLGHSEDDNLLEVYLDDAKYEFLSYTGRKDIPKAAMGVIEDMVIAKYNQRGNEGLAITISSITPIAAFGISFLPV